MVPFNTICSTWSTVPIPSGYGDSAIIGIVDNHIELELVRNSEFSAGIIFIHYSQGLAVGTIVL